MTAETVLLVCGVVFSGVNTALILKVTFRAGELVQELKDHGRRLDVVEERLGKVEAGIPAVCRFVKAAAGPTGWGASEA